jgi:hypothetical protein
MKDWGLEQSFFYSFRVYRAFIRWEEERVSFEMFSVIIMVDRDIHEMAPVKVEGPTLFGFSKNTGPHNFSRTI